MVSRADTSGGKVWPRNPRLERFREVLGLITKGFDLEADAVDEEVSQRAREMLKQLGVRPRERDYG